MEHMELGTLYGVGVGPGAPDLLTLRAVQVLQKVDVILTAASPRNDYSTALTIASPHLPENTPVLRLEFPMTRDKDALQKAWCAAARKALEVLRQGKNAAFLTLGDPLIYSTFSYLLNKIREEAPELCVEIVPGITSFQAAAARVQKPLCEGAEPLMIIPGIKNAKDLEQSLQVAENAVILKAYRNFDAIKSALDATGRLSQAVLASHVGMEQECIYAHMDAAPEVPPYFSLVLSKK